jgi:hypothetical protein
MNLIRQGHCVLTWVTVILPSMNLIRSTQWSYQIRVIDISITVTQVSTQCSYPIRVIDVNTTVLVTQVSTQFPYPIRVIDVSIIVTQVSTRNTYVYDSY